MNSTVETECLSLIQISSQPTAAVRISIYFTSVVNGLSMLTATLGNLLILLIIWRFERLHFPSSVLVASLCLCDLIIGLVVQPLGILSRMFDLDPHAANCQLKTAYRYFGIFAVGLSVVSIAMVSADRSLAVNLPFRYQKFAGNSRYGKTVVIVWVSWGLLSILPLLDGIPLQLSYQLLFGVVVGFFIVILVSYFKIIRVMYRQKRRIATVAILTESIHRFDFNENQNDASVFLGATTSRRQRRYSINDSNSQSNGYSASPKSRLPVNSMQLLALPPIIVSESDSTNLQTLPSTPEIEPRGSINSLLNSDGEFHMRRKRAQSIFRSTRNFAADVVKRSTKEPSQRSGTSTVLIVVTLLIICFLPKTILFLISSCCSHLGGNFYIADMWSDMFMFLNSALNPFIYSFRSRNIKDCIFQVVKRKQDAWELEEQ